MKRRILLFGFCCIMLGGCVGQKQQQGEEPNSQTQTVTDVAKGRIGDEVPVTRAMAAKMIAMAFYTKEELDGLKENTKFLDVKETDWYAPYVSGVVELGFMLGDDEGFHPEEFVTLEQTQVLMDTLNPDSTSKIKLTEETKNKPVSYSLWMQVFQDALSGRRAEKSLYSYGMEETELVFLKRREDGTWLTTEGIYDVKGYDVQKYQGEKLKAITKDHELLALLEVTQQDARIENVGFSLAENILTIHTGYGKMKFAYEGETPKTTKGFGDIQLQDMKAVEMIPAKKLDTEVLKRANTTELYLEKTGNLAWENNFKIYQEKDGQFVPKGVSSLICGTEIADFYVQQGKVAVAVIRRTPNVEKIRVLLNTTGFQGYLHDIVELTCTEDVKISYGQKEKVMTKGNRLRLTKEVDGGLFEQPRITITPQNHGMITVSSILRNTVAPSYQGNLEIEKTDQGYIIVNELPIEEYLKGVVPSEMPVSFGLEPLKVQAVSARSYAYNQFFANACGDHGAHVDDSTLFQMYLGNIDSPLAEEAVDATQGRCLVYENKVVNANFFSTSCGYTANSGQVWASNNGKEFPSKNREYLISKRQGIEKDYGDLSKNETMRTFLQDKDAKGYDSNSPWYRWQMTIPAAELTEILQSGVNEIWKTTPVVVKVLQGDKTWKSSGFEELGTIQKVSIVERGAGGNAMVMEVIGEKQTVRISTEFAIRKVLKPSQIGEGNPILTSCSDGSQRENLSLLPSGFFVIQEKKNEQGALENITLIGGGSGHGVGMSQYGAKYMAEHGFSYEKILEHYFNGAKVYQVISPEVETKE